MKSNSNLFSWNISHTDIQNIQRCLLSLTGGPWENGYYSATPEKIESEPDVDKGDALVVDDYDEENVIDDDDSESTGIRSKSRSSGSQRVSKKDGNSTAKETSGSAATHGQVAAALQPKCTSQSLANIECYLETKDLWKKFYELGTEMIITKTGRFVTFNSGIFPIPRIISVRVWNRTTFQYV